MRKGLGDAVSEREGRLCPGLTWVPGPWAVAGNAPVWGFAETHGGQSNVVCVGGGSRKHQENQGPSGGKSRLM